MESKDKSDSKTKLNESTQPLLDNPEKEKIEMETKNDNTKETEEVPKDVKETEEDKDKSKKKDKKKEKKPKEKKEHRRTASCVEQLTSALSLQDRDDKHINDHINLVFDDVLAEPAATHGFDGVWKMAYVLFFTTQQWIYRIATMLLALPCGIVWGFLFSIIAIVNIWLITPLLRIYDVLMHILHRLWGGLIRSILDPIFASVCNARASYHMRTSPTAHTMTDP